MWERQSHLLQPLTILIPNIVKFKWTFAEYKSSNDINRIVACNSLLDYPIFNYKMMYARVLENSNDGLKPFVFYSSTLIEHQKRYTETKMSGSTNHC